MIFLSPLLCISFVFTPVCLVVARWLPAAVRAVCFLMGSRGRHHGIPQHQAELMSFALIRPALHQPSGPEAEHFPERFSPHFHWGEVSPSQLFWLLHEGNGRMAVCAGEDSPGAAQGTGTHKMAFFLFAPKPLSPAFQAFRDDPSLDVSP